MCMLQRWVCDCVCYKGGFMTVCYKGGFECVCYKNGFMNVYATKMGL